MLPSAMFFLLNFIHIIPANNGVTCLRFSSGCYSIRIQICKFRAGPRCEAGHG